MLHSVVQGEHGLLEPFSCSFDTLYHVMKGWRNHAFWAAGGLLVVYQARIPTAVGLMTFQELLHCQFQPGHNAGHGGAWRSQMPFTGSWAAL